MGVARSLRAKRFRSCGTRDHERCEHVSSVVWSRKGEEGPYRAEIDVCVRIGDEVRLSYSNKKKGFGGRFTFEARQGLQQTVGTWQWDGDKGWNAKVSGEVTSLSSDRFEFEGTWDENDGALWDFSIECRFTDTAGN